LVPLMYMLPATPTPLPYGSRRNFRFHSDAPSTAARHSGKPFDVMRRPFTVGRFSPMKFFRRTSIGSMPTASASLSSWHSNAKRGWTEPCPRLGPQHGLFVNTRVESNR
jgi:hypothetical protein